MTTARNWVSKDRHAALTNGSIVWEYASKLRLSNSTSKDVICGMTPESCPSESCKWDIRVYGPSLVGEWIPRHQWVQFVWPRITRAKPMHGEAELCLRRKAHSTKQNRARLNLEITTAILIARQLNQPDLHSVVTSASIVKKLLFHDSKICANYSFVFTQTFDIRWTADWIMWLIINIRHTFLPSPVWNGGLALIDKRVHTARTPLFRIDN